MTEGVKTEVQYIEGLVQYLKSTGITVHVPQTCGVGRDPLGVLREAEEIRDQAISIDPFDDVWIVVDVDQHTTLEECLREARRGGVSVVVTNPCFELWLLWHFEFSKNKDHDADSLAALLAKHGHFGKSVSPDFPFASYVNACECAKRFPVTHGSVGKVPSSAMPHLIEVFIAN
ncbi:RloB family protein [Kribbella sp. NPDC005582]|uniref:RloB family protein n=1 Tax=Kribbella sp. NPDC005582 TaxID=3156893 RepID=UPI0033AF5BAC